MLVKWASSDDQNGGAAALQAVWARAMRRLQSWRVPEVVFLTGMAHVADDDQAHAAMVSAFGAWCAVHAGVVCVVALPGRCLRQAVATPDMAVAVARQQALTQWQHYLNMDESALKTQWVIRQVSEASAALVCAAPQALVSGLQAQAHLHGVRIDNMVPWWAHAVNAWLLGWQPSGSGQTMRHLSLLEPGLATRVEARCEAGQSAVLSRLWVEHADSAADFQGDMALNMPPANQAGEALWDHPLVAAVVRGQVPARRVTA